MENQNLPFWDLIPVLRESDDDLVTLSVVRRKPVGNGKNEVPFKEITTGTYRNPNEQQSLQGYGVEASSGALSTPEEINDHHRGMFLCCIWTFSLRCSKSDLLQGDHNKA